MMGTKRQTYSVDDASRASTQNLYALRGYDFFRLATCREQEQTPSISNYAKSCLDTAIDGLSGDLVTALKSGMGDKWVGFVSTPLGLEAFFRRYRTDESAGKVIICEIKTQCALTWPCSWDETYVPFLWTVLACLDRYFDKSHLCVMPVCANKKSSLEAVGRAHQTLIKKSVLQISDEWESSEGPNDFHYMFSKETMTLLQTVAVDSPDIDPEYAHISIVEDEYPEDDISATDSDTEPDSNDTRLAKRKSKIAKTVKSAKPRRQQPTLFGILGIPTPAIAGDKSASASIQPSAPKAAEPPLADDSATASLLRSVLVKRTNDKTNVAHIAIRALRSSAFKSQLPNAGDMSCTVIDLEKWTDNPCDGDRLDADNWQGGVENYPTKYDILNWVRNRPLEDAPPKPIVNA